MLRQIASLIIKTYQAGISPLLGDCCRFYPSCSRYAQVAIERYGVCYGVWLTWKRLLKCHPWHQGIGYDPVPEKEAGIGKNIEIIYDR